MKRLLPALASCTTLCLAGATTNAATITWVGGSGSATTGSNWSSGVNPFSDGSADDLVIGGSVVADNGSVTFRVEDGDSLTLKDNAALWHTRTGSNTRFDSSGTLPFEDVFVEDNAIVAMPATRRLDFFLSDAGSIVITDNGNANPFERNANQANVNIAAGWTGSIFIAGRDTDFVNDLIDDRSFFFDGVKLTSDDLGTKYLLNDTSVSGDPVPTFSVEAQGIYITAVPEPGSLALLGLGGLLVAVRRRR